MTLSIEYLIAQTSYLKSETLDKIKDKNVYILGTKTDLSDVIINAPYLVRLNESGYWGSCDLWVNNSEIAYYDLSRSYRANTIMRMPVSEDCEEMAINYPKDFVDSTYFISPKEREATIKESGISNPLLCTLVVHWFYRHTQCDIVLLNCSFTNRVTRYPDKGVTYLDDKYHPEKDKEFLSSLPRIKFETINL